MLKIWAKTAINAFWLNPFSFDIKKKWVSTFLNFYILLILEI